jgi:hypothetical protein
MLKLDITFCFWTFTKLQSEVSLCLGWRSPSWIMHQFIFGQVSGHYNDSLRVFLYIKNFLLIQFSFYRADPGGQSINMPYHTTVMSDHIHVWPFNP